MEDTILDTINALLGGFQRIAPEPLRGALAAFRALSPHALRMAKALANNPDVPDEELWMDMTKEVMRQRATLKFGK